MEKSWQQVNRDVDLMFDHQVFSERVILGLFVLSIVAVLLGAPKGWSLLWVLPTIGYCLGRHVTENLHHHIAEYWVVSLGSQVLLGLIVGILLLSRLGA